MRKARFIFEAPPSLSSIAEALAARSEAPVERVEHPGPFCGVGQTGSLSLAPPLELDFEAYPDAIAVYGRGDAFALALEILTDLGGKPE